MAPKSGTRDRILGVAKTLFAARGYEHASTSSIARQAGTSESQLMKHFGSKAGLLEAIFSVAWARINDHIILAVAGVTDPSRKLEVISGQVLMAMEADAELKLLMLLEGRRIRREGSMVVLTDAFMTFVRMIDSVLEEMQANGQLRPNVQPQAIRSALMGMLEGMLRDRFLAERLGFPATFDMQQIAMMLDTVLASCIVASSAAA